MEAPQHKTTIDMYYEKIVDFIKNVGFPIGVAIYLLYRGDTMLKEMTQAVETLTVATREQTRAMESMQRELIQRR